MQSGIIRNYREHKNQESNVQSAEGRGERRLKRAEGRQASPYWDGTGLFLTARQAVLLKRTKLSSYTLGFNLFSNRSVEAFSFSVQ